MKNIYCFNKQTKETSRIDVDEFLELCDNDTPFKTVFDHRYNWLYRLLSNGEYEIRDYYFSLREFDADFYRTFTDANIEPTAHGIIESSKAGGE